jgi:hypothetical protein
MDDEQISTKGPSDWQPITNKADLAVLGKLGEEVNELGSAIFRCIIQGLDEREPTTGKLNRDWLEDEVADVLALSNFVIGRFKLDEKRIAKRIALKRGYKAPWFDALAREDQLWAGGTPNDGESIGMKYGPSPNRQEIVDMLDEGDVLVLCGGDEPKVVAKIRNGQLEEVA